MRSAPRLETVTSFIATTLTYQYHLAVAGGSAVGNYMEETHPLPRGGTDFATRQRRFPAQTLPSGGADFMGTELHWYRLGPTSSHFSERLPTQKCHRDLLYV